MRLRFGEWVFDGDTRQLLRQGRAAPVRPKAFDLLEFLLEQRPRVLAKARIRARMWPSTFISEASLATVVHDIRTTLGDDARRPRFVRTAHGIGYAFCGEAIPEAAPAAAEPAASTEYRVIWKRREIALGPGEHVLGRTHAAAVWVDHGSVSRRHALIRVSAAGATIEDEGSKNGTFVAGVRIRALTPLADGDVIHLGHARLLFRVFSGEGSTTTAGRSGG